MSRTKIKLGKEIKRTVPVLFPKTRMEVTEEQVTFYANHHPYAFPIDRQSDRREMARAEATGAQRRVSAIITAASEHKFYIPVPVRNEAQVDGELPFLYDQRFWYVDGTGKNATGHAASQNARPRLWDGFLLAQALAERGVGPRAFIVGEATRFFRNEKWLMEFTHSLWSHNIKLIVCGFGEVNKNTLGGLIAYINALSGWLPEVRKGAREARKEAGKLWTIKMPVGLRASGATGMEPPETRTHVWTDSATWPAITRMAEQMAEGAVKNSKDAAIYLNDVEGLSLSDAWVQRFFRSPIPDGVYPSYDHVMKPRIVEQSGGLFQDLDIRDSGARRYLTQDQAGVDFPINYSPGTSSIPSDTLIKARSRVIKNRGRPNTARDTSQILLPTRFIECKHCGASVTPVPPWASEGRWYAHCNSPHRLRINNKWSIEKARTYIQETCPHSLGGHVNIGELVWEMLSEGIENNPTPPTEPSIDEVSEKRRVELALLNAEEAFDQFQARCFRGECGDQTNDRVRKSIEQERARLLEEVDKLQKEVDKLASRRLTEHQAAMSRRRLSHLIRLRVRDRAVSLQDKQEILQSLVTRVVVDFDVRHWTAYLDVPWAKLRQIEGDWDEDGKAYDISKSVGFQSTFQIVLQGSWAA